MSQGAIPIVLFKTEQPQYFAAKATFSTAIGLRPMAAFVSTGWDENLISQPAGSYIVQLNSSTVLYHLEKSDKVSIYFIRPKTLTAMYQVMKLLLILLPTYPI